MKLTLLPAATRVAQPWKNGGGVTREVAIFPHGADLDAFDWRVSIAEVTVSGPFSRFDNIERVLTVLKGAMRLRIDGGRAVRLTSDSAPFAFPGDVACESEILEPVIDLNLMVRRGLKAHVARATGPVLRLAAPIGMFVATELSNVRELSLTPLDAISLESMGEEALDGSGWLISIDETKS